MPFEGVFNGTHSGHQATGLEAEVLGWEEERRSSGLVSTHEALNALKEALTAFPDTPPPHRLPTKKESAHQKQRRTQKNKAEL